jgi:CubicO group peptidase (beta-lactamase class C family)
MTQGTCTKVLMVSLSWACALAPGCLPDGKLKIAYNDEALAYDDGWQVSTPAAEGFDPAALRAAYAAFFSEDQYVVARSLLVVRHGKLVAEGYCRSLEDRTRLRNIQSVTQSVTSLLFGIAHGEGRFPDVGGQIWQYLPRESAGDAVKQTLSLSDLLTMRSGLDIDNDTFTEQVLDNEEQDSVRFILRKPLVDKPGARFAYKDADVHVLGGILQEVMGKKLQEQASARLFAPLGITDFVWNTHVDGVDYGATSLFLRPRDLAKLGQLTLNRGSWKGQSVVSQAWIEASTSTKAETPATPLGFSYGYLWWTLPGMQAYTAWGHGGQFVMVVPPSELVIVMTSEPSPNDEVAGIELGDFMPLARQIVSALVD